MNVTLVESVDCSSAVVSAAICPTCNMNHVSDETTLEVYKVTIWPSRALQRPGLFDLLSRRK